MQVQVQQVKVKVLRFSTGSAQVQVQRWVEEMRRDRLAEGRGGAEVQRSRCRGAKVLKRCRGHAE